MLKHGGSGPGGLVAGRASRSSDLRGLVEEGAPADPWKSNIEGIREPKLRRTICFECGDFIGESALEAVSEFGEALSLFVKRLFGDAGGFAEGDDCGDRLGSRAAAAFVVGSGEDRLQRASLAHVEGTDSFRSVHLVAGQREEIDAELIDVDGDFGSGLSGIRMEDGVVSVRELGAPANRLDHTGFVVAVHHGDDGSVVVDVCFERIDVDASAVVNPDAGDTPAIRFEAVAGCCDGGMFDGGGHEVSW